jgi:methanesulfonate monooxygenase small subunit
MATDIQEDKMQVTYEVEKAAREVISASCDAMDREDFASYLSLCSPEFQYAIRAYSPEIRRDMTWLEKDREHMKTLLDLLPKQNRDRNPIFRHVSTREVTSANGKDEVTVRSDLQVYRVLLDGGEPQLFAVGKYVDRVDMSGDEPKIVDREVRLDSRSLGAGYHIPF